MNFMRFCFNPYTIFPVFTPLSDFADINLRIKVGSKSFMMITGIAIYDIEVLNLVEMMFGSISGVNAGYTWVETTT